MAKLSDATLKDLANGALTQSDIKAAVEAAVKAALTTPANVDVEVELLNAPANSANYNKGDKVKAKVTLKSKKDAKAIVTKEFEGNVAK